MPALNETADDKVHSMQWMTWWMSRWMTRVDDLGYEALDESLDYSGFFCDELGG